MLSLDLCLTVWKLITHSQDCVTGSFKVMASLHVLLTTGQGLLVSTLLLADYQLVGKTFEEVKFFLQKTLAIRRSLSTVAIRSEESV